MVTKVLEREISVFEVESFTVYIWRMTESAIVLRRVVLASAWLVYAGCDLRDTGPKGHYDHDLTLLRHLQGPYEVDRQR